jgi:uncharacterized protein (PEP-CTERM system associated)
MSLAFVTGPSLGQNWRLDEAVSVRETLSNNVNLTPNDGRRSDLITELIPSLHISEKGARTSLSGFVAVPVVLYARTGGENNNAYPSANILGDVQLIENWLHVEGEVTIAQQYFSPFGAQPLGLDNATQNRYQTNTYRVTPYIKGVTPGKTHYELRNNNIWNNTSSAPVPTSDFRSTEFTGNATNTETTIGWRAEFDVNDWSATDSDTFRSRLVRLTSLYNATPQLRLSAIGGYEQNHYPLSSSDNGIYGAGFEWHPTPRTDVVGWWEHRFFGGAYLFTFDHHTPLSVWKVHISRNITTYPQQLASLPAGGDVASLLNTLFLTTIPDPTQRQQTVDQFIRDRGLPTVLSGALTLYSQQTLLEESQTASVGLLGTRNTVILTIYNVRSQPISASGDVLSGLVPSTEDTNQTGISLAWSHKLTPSLVLDATVDRFRTVANPPLEGKTNQAALRLVLSTPLSAKTTIFAGARYQTLTSTLVSPYDEAAAFIGVTHTFQ